MGPWKVTIREVSPAEFWQHGYRFGYQHGTTGFPNILDDERTFPDADVIPFPSPAQRAAET